MDILLDSKSNWANYDTRLFPNVTVTLNEKINNDKEFQKFLDDWEELYQRNENFIIHFDATQVGWVSMKYCFKMRTFIRKIKKEYPNILQKSYIKTNSKWVRFLLGTIFFLEKPVAPVHVYSEGNNNTKIYNP